MTTPEKIRVGLEGKSYDIFVGSALLENAPDLIVPLLKRKRLVIVTDETVAALHLQPLLDRLTASDIETHKIILPAGEKTKSFNHLEQLCDDLIRLQIERSDVIVALGGGVIGDLTGFASAILRRGCRFVQIPTTLLAQVDSSVGGKTAINAQGGKNLIGAFHQPSIVLADISLIESLPRRELLAGYAEIVKYGLLGDAAFFEWLEQNGAALLAGDTKLRTEAVLKSVAAKARIVEEDEHEQGLRALLNLGHTFGHAFEAQMGYSDKLLHGEAVALGMVMAFEFSSQQGLCPSADVERVKAHLLAAGLPVSLQNVDGFSAASSDLMAHIYQDKKVSEGKLTFILAKAIGSAFVAKNIDPDLVEQFLSTQL